MAQGGGFEVRVDDLSDERVQDLLRLHLRGMHAHSPPGAVFALDLSGLRRPGITAWTAWQGERVAGIGALRDLGGRQGEVKSMRTHPDFLRQGVGALVLETIIGAARAAGMSRVSLETGSGPAFEPALALYRRRGFQPGEAFGDYEASPFNRFFHLAL
ncbi:MAG: GNAT family N-acetyltransferase [Alphaproteobacteria bacterium]